ncbi:phage/plasmid replication protein, II/X family [Pseudohongiella spirulinae]|uniref:II/X family phage/plasmid replication protein n=1 Tax=Pseudohongiella spirulinae TaxID=1249552 RepID=A0A0S2KCZ0_9GAMM|nr:phage/plasmid replication protein, II/X family [Pseudohongiella spirulinae]ALO46180.1 II/X family phage/plasmid replication protein [Pseudohongiella spirulinae]ALO46183.1 II/X family phage/plasmid replication protein [Pseudohongiella spirulinae]
MIDWVTAIIPFDHEPLNSGSVLKIAPSGEIEWESPCRIQVEGSHESGIQVRSHGGNGEGRASELMLHGNPAKFLQGHNVFGIDDLRMLVFGAFINVCNVLKLNPDRRVYERVAAGGYRLTRIDINYMYELPSAADVRSWLRAAEYKSKTRHGRPSSKAGTLYWGKNSRRWAIKAYSKGEEINGPKSHKLPDRFSETPIAEFAQNKLRIELTLRAKELEKINLLQADEWGMKTPYQIFNDYVKRIEMSEQIALTTDKLSELPRHLKGTYILWRSGENLRENLSKPTFYKHRKELLELGVDINLAVDSVDRSNVVPLIRVLEAQPVQTPTWAYDLRLIYPECAA